MVFPTSPDFVVTAYYLESAYSVTALDDTAALVTALLGTLCRGTQLSQAWIPTPQKL